MGLEVAGSAAIGKQPDAVAHVCGLARGAYMLADAKGGRPSVILIGTGSEVALCGSDP